MCCEVYMKKAIQRIASRIYDRWMKISERYGGKYMSKRIEKELQQLNPGKNVKMTIRDYYVEKIQIGLVGMGVCGIVIVLGIGNVMMNGDLKDGRFVKKEELGGGKKEVKLQAQIGEIKVKEILLEVDEKELSDDEEIQLLQNTIEQLPEKILGKNESLLEVKEPLVLMTSWEDTGISIFWNSSNYEIVKADGTLFNENVSVNGEEVILTALVSLKNRQEKREIPIVVYPKEKEKNDLIKEELLSLIKEQTKEQQGEEYIVLPETWNHTQIIWREEHAQNIVMLSGLMVIGIWGIMWGKDQDIHKQYEIRNRKLLLEYSEVVSKLQLLISSGVSVRGAFSRLAKEYEKRKKQGGTIKCAYEELLVVIRKMESGMGEIEAYQYFAKRCDLICYKKLTAILTQNVKRGTEGLKESLCAETRNAFEVRKQEVKKLGEEAGTKLLAPMMMMMSIILLIIVVPAYFSFGGI